MYLLPIYIWFLLPVIGATIDLRPIKLQVHNSYKRTLTAYKPFRYCQINICTNMYFNFWLS